MADIASHIIVCGVVQGVGFRYFVFRHAMQLGLHGKVWNRNDGNVEIVVEGDRSLIEEFIKNIQVGPQLSHVTDISVEWQPPDYKYTNFEIG